MKVQQLDGQLTITRKHGEGIRLIVEDQTSAATILEVTLSLDAFAHVVTGLGQVPCSVRRHLNPFIGLRPQVEHRFVKLDKNIYFMPLSAAARQEAITNALAFHEKDGWRADLEAFEGTRRWDEATECVAVIFRRWVDQEGQPHVDDERRQEA